MLATDTLSRQTTSNDAESPYLYPIFNADWMTSFTATEQQAAISALEAGQVLSFPELVFSLTREEAPLLSPHMAHSKAKNISYDRNRRRTQGMSELAPVPALTALLHRFSEYAHALLMALLPSYGSAVRVGRTSLRVVEISGRLRSMRQDDTRLHVDAFPSTPVQGWRILRVFSNVNPHGLVRAWRLGEPFEAVAQRFLPRIPGPMPGLASLLRALRVTKTLRTHYDYFMLGLHDTMKADEHYQETVSQVSIDWPSGSSWMAMTDHVSYAAMAGQYLLEQTFYVPLTVMADVDRSPLRVLERFLKQSLL